ncbi:MAG: hypothetical protein U0360_03875 [Dehalococcoidia bacterium]
MVTGRPHVDCGWAELVRAEDGQVLGRGRLMIYRDAATSAAVAHVERQGAAGDDLWRGQLDDTHLGDAVGDDLDDLLGQRRLRVEFPDARSADGPRAAGQELTIEVVRVHGLASRQAVLDVRSTDGVLPAMLTELGGN